MSMMSMTKSIVDWVSQIKVILGVDDETVMISQSTILLDIFQQSTTPEIYINSRGKLTMPERFSIKPGGCKKIHRLLKHPEIFNASPIQFRKSLFDLLFLILRRETYDVIRFQSIDIDDSENDCSLVRLLLILLDHSIQVNAPIAITKRVIHLIGIVASVGITATDLKIFLSFLNTPSELTVSLLQAFMIMIRQDNGVVKAAPTSLFMFGGSGSGLYSNTSLFPFSREYHFCTWFRVENFEEDIIQLSKQQKSKNPTETKAFNKANASCQHIFTWQNVSSQKGLDVYFEKKILTVAISNNNTSKPADPIIVKLNQTVIKRGVWYHISIRHSKPRMALFGSDELVIHIDFNQVFQDNIRFPNLGNQSECEFIFGMHFDGQLSPIYVFAEALPLPAVEVIAKIDGGKAESSENTATNYPTVVDLLVNVTTNDRKIHTILPRLGISYHPTRCSEGYALDIFGGRHCKMKGCSDFWNIVNARDLLNTFGGITCLLPLFPRLLIEHDKPNSSPHYKGAQNVYTSVYSNNNVPLDPSHVFNLLGSSLADFNNDQQIDSYLDYSILSILNAEREIYKGDSCIGLLFAILAKCITNNKRYQQELLVSGSVEMIEYALSCVPQEILQLEGEKSIVSLIQLKSVASDSLALELRITKSLLCNVTIWSRASFQLLSSLMSVILAAIRAQPDVYLDLLGVQTLLSSLAYFFTPSDGTEENLHDDSVQQQSYATMTVNVTQNKEMTIAIDTPDDIDESDGNRSDLSASKSILEELDVSMKYSKSISSPVDTNSLYSDSSNVEDGSDILSPLKAASSQVKRSLQRKSKSFKIFLSEEIAQSSLQQEDTQSDQNPILSPLTAESEIRSFTPPSQQRRSITSTSGHDHHIDHSEDDQFVRTSLAELPVGIISILHEGESAVRSSKSSANPKALYALNVPGSSDEHMITDELYTPKSEGRYTPISKSPAPPPVSPQTKEQKKLLRDSIESMIVIIVQQGSTEKEITPLLDFMVMCKNAEVANEIAQVLLYLIVEGGPKIISAIITSCNGIEEFASFVLTYIIHKPFEDLRCTGIRLLTHFYLRLDGSIPPSITNLTLKKKKEGLIFRAIGNITQQSNYSNLSSGLEQLNSSGGLALLCETVGYHSQTSTEQTYAALLELLLTKPGSKSQVTVQYLDLFDTSMSNMNMNTKATSTNVNSMRRRTVSSAHNAGTNKGQRAVVFAAHYLSPDQVHDEGINMTNSVVLPIFFELLPKLPVNIQEQIYSDLLALLKHSTGNRDGFCNSPSWHICMYGLVAQLARVDEGDNLKSIHSFDILNEIEKYLGINMLESPHIIMAKRHKHRVKSPHDVPFSVLNKTKKETTLTVENHKPSGELLRSWNNEPVNARASYSYSKDRKTAPLQIETNKERPSLLGNGDKENTEANENHHIWFVLGMKIYATLLLHAIEYKGGWKEVDRSISQFDGNNNCNDLGYSVSQAILSHLLNELTFNMRSKYRELQRLAKSTNSNENHEATDRLENIFSIMISASQLALIDQSCATGSLNAYHVNKLRLKYFNQLCTDLISKKQSNSKNKSFILPNNGVSFNNSNNLFSQITQLEMRQVLEQTELLLKRNMRLVPFIALDSINIGFQASPERESSFSNFYEDNSVFVDDNTDLISRHHGYFVDNQVPNSNAPFIPHNQIPPMVDDHEAISPLHNEETTKNFYVASELKEYDEYLDLTHHWYDITDDSNLSSLGSPYSNTTKAPLKQANLSQNYSGFKSIEELLHPLERDHNVFMGKLILVLQTLRFFDSIFWPNEPGPVRNATMLRYFKESSVIGDIHKDLQQSNANNNNGMNNQEPPVSSANFSIQQISLFSSVMRMCIFVLVNLIPMSHLAVLNLKRIRVLICSLDKVTPFNTPTHDWLLLILLHVSIGLQRLYTALEPVYEMILSGDSSTFDSSGNSLNPQVDHDNRFSFSASPSYYKLLIPTVGPWNDSYDDYDRLDEKENEKFDKVIENKEIVEKLLHYFDCPPGRHLIRNMRTSLFILVDSFEMHHSKLSAALEERTFRSLYVLVEHIKADLQVQNIATKHEAKILVKNFSKLDSISIDTAGDIFDGSSSSDASHSPVPTNINIAGSRARASSRSSSDLSDSSNEQHAPTIEAVSDSHHHRNITTETFEESFTITDILLVLKWLRYPYFKINFFRNLGLVKAADAIDYLESQNTVRFTNESRVLRQGLEDQRDLAVKSFNEMIELKELSIQVNNLFTSRYKSRMASISSLQAVKFKNVATCWHDYIQLYEGDWSIWQNEDTANNNNNNSCENLRIHPPLTTTIISKHIDNKLRRMMLHSSHEVIDHNNAAYFEGKAKDQLNYESGGINNNSTSTSEKNNNNNPNMINIPFKISKNMLGTNPSIMNEVNNSTWGDDDLDDHDDIGENNGTNNNNPMSGNNNTTGQNNSGKSIGNIFFQGNEKRPTWTYSYLWLPDEKSIYLTDVTQINIDSIMSGTILLTNKCIYFHAKKRIGGLSVNNQILQADNVERYKTEQITELYGRRYLLTNCGLEIMFNNTQSSLFIAFNTRAELLKFYRNLKRQMLPLLNSVMSSVTSLNPKIIFNNSNLTELWKKRQISNFEYLMKLNLISGRSYSDITQYPVFPWILIDYTSNTIDLNNPSVYRPLDKPIGALNPARLLEYKERYKMFDDDVPKFLYGSHYSSAGVVINYLIRQEPFTTLAINLQGGRFDCPDRIFFDIRRTWIGCNNAMSDVKELIPEMFCCPEILLNTNNLPLGHLQDGDEPVNDVLLPPWSKNNPFEFIRIQREALESDFVSDNLHDWIDLIFGYKQTGAPAIAANNVFHYLTYENAINLEKIEDPLQKEAAKAQVIHFGQTPSQLLTKEHPKRLPKEECSIPILSDTSTILKLKVYTPLRQLGNTNNNNFGSIISIRSNAEKLIVIHSNLTVCFYKWNTFIDTDGNPFTVKADRYKALPSLMLSASEEILSYSNSINAKNNMINASDRDSMSTVPISNGNDSNTISSSRTSSSDRPTSTSVSMMSVLRSSFRLKPTNNNMNESSLLTTANNNSNNNIINSNFNILNGNSIASINNYNSSISIMIGCNLSNETKQILYSYEEKLQKHSPSPTSLPQITTKPSSYTNTRKSIASKNNNNLYSNFNYNNPIKSMNLLFPNLTHQQISLQMMNDSTTSRVLTCGYWDNSIKVNTVDNNLKEVCSTGLSRIGSITCIAQVSTQSNNNSNNNNSNSSNGIVISGCSDGTCSVWVVEKPLFSNLYHNNFGATIPSELYFSEYLNDIEYDINSSSTGPNNVSSNNEGSNPMVCIYNLYGHHSPVTSISYSIEMDVVLSSSVSGLLCLHTVKTGKYIRSINLNEKKNSVDLVLATSPGYLIAHSWIALELYLFWINGEHLMSIKLLNKIECMVTSSNGSILICGGANGLLSIRTTHDLQELYFVDLQDHGAIKCL
eukprot:gene11916-15945_t